MEHALRGIDETIDKLKFIENNVEKATQVSKRGFADPATDMREFANKAVDSSEISGHGDKYKQFHQMQRVVDSAFDIKTFKHGIVVELERLREGKKRLQILIDFYRMLYNMAHFDGDHDMQRKLLDMIIESL